MHNITTNKNQ